MIPISHVVTSSTGTTNTNPISSSGPVVKTTGNGSHGIGTGAIAGIAIAIVLIACLCGSFFVFRHLRSKRRSQKLAATAAPVAEAKAVSDSDSDHKDDFSDGPEVKKNRDATVTVNEVPMTPPSEADGNDFFAPSREKSRPQSRFELPGEPVDRSEMPSPSPEDLRSELSTPEPKWNYPELPSPDPSQELPSPGLSSADSGHPSPDPERRRSPSLENRRSALTSPEPRLPLQRPDTIRADSSDSEGGWPRDGRPVRSFHRRYGSDDSDAPSVSTRPRHSHMESSDSDLLIHFNRIDESSAESESPSASTRPTVTHVDSSDLESPIPTPSVSSSTSRPQNTRMDSGSEPEGGISAANPRRGGTASTFHSSSSTRPAPTFHSSSSSRPGLHRLSAVRPTTLRRDSDSFQTRLESASDTHSSTAGSRFGSIVVGHQRGESAVYNETRDGFLDEGNTTRHDG